ncbi:microsomal signal peptidase 12 kDa subunit-domain-containing protein [Xylariaceae sp. FL0255]|nr:microsomal signal peptidase 12 kDa subunit-domain-containing protein [Xylariaceae sp. FL0255]
MAEQLLDQVRDIVDGQIDFEGQKLAEILSTVLLSVVGVCSSPPPPPLASLVHCVQTKQLLVQAIAFIVGYFLQDITLALKIGLAGTALTFLAIVPPWPFFKQHPVKWLPVGGSSVPTQSQNIVIDEKMLAQR